MNDNIIIKNVTLFAVRLVNLYKKMDIIVGNSEAVVAELIEEGVPLKCLDLIYNGVDLNSYKFNYDRSSLRQQLSISMERIVFICVANLHRYKGHYEIVEAFSKVEELMPDKCQVLFIGRDVGFSADLMDRVNELNLSQKIFLPINNIFHSSIPARVKVSIPRIRLHQFSL